MLFEACKTYEDLASLVRKRFQMSRSDYERFCQTYRRVKYLHDTNRNGASALTDTPPNINNHSGQKGHENYDGNH
jgi:hypothetical protein